MYEDQWLEDDFVMADGRDEFLGDFDSKFTDDLAAECFLSCYDEVFDDPSYPHTDMTGSLYN